MNLQKIFREMGLFETVQNLSKVMNSQEVIDKVGGYAPLPPKSIVNTIQEASKWLIDLNKQKYMFLSPEIALIEEMSQYANEATETIIVIPADLEVDIKDRLQKNLSKKIKIELLEESFFPQQFLPSNAVIVASGYLGNGRMFVLPDTYRMLEHYSGFYGDKVFIPYVELDTAQRYKEWMELSLSSIDKVHLVEDQS